MTTKQTLPLRNDEDDYSYYDGFEDGEEIDGDYIGAFDGNTRPRNRPQKRPRGNVGTRSGNIGRSII